MCSPIMNPFTFWYLISSIVSKDSIYASWMFLQLTYMVSMDINKYIKIPKGFKLCKITNLKSCNIYSSKLQWSLYD